MSEFTEEAVSEKADGRVYWRSMEQLAGSPEYQRFLENEFPAGPEVPDGLAEDGVSRRGFIGVVAAAVAMASTTACRKPVRKILPFAKRPEDMTPGLPSYYATTLMRGGYGTGVLARSNDGRPTKIEGNRLHPSSLGGADAYLQAEVLNLYDPARSQRIWHGDDGTIADGESRRPLTFADFEAAWGKLKGGLGDGSGLAFLMGPTTSPTVLELIDGVKAAYSEATFAFYEPINRDNEVAGSRLAFGKALDPQYDFAAADVVVALDSDFLSADTNALRHAREFASRRRPHKAGGAARLNRLYAVESSVSITGGQADHRFAVRAHEVADVAFALAAELGVLSGALADAVSAHKQHAFTSSKGVNWVAAIAKDLLDHRGQSLLVAGPRQPAVVHAVVHAVNAALGNVGRAVTYTDTPAQIAESQRDSVTALTAAMNAGSVSTLFILGGNPVYDAPADLDFAAALAKVETSVHYGLFRDETAHACSWHINATHELEAWGDGLAFDGTASIVQPLIAPLYGAKSPIELFAMLSGSDEREGHELVRYHWEDSVRTDDVDAWWRLALRDGVVHDSAHKAAAPPALQAAAIAAAVQGRGKAAAASAASLEVTFAQDAMIYDGRYANNPWMQECSHPVTKLTWDNAAVMGIGTAEALGVVNDDVIKLDVGGRSVEAPVWIVPGVVDFSIALTLGYGRDVPGLQVAQGAGFDAYRLRTGGAFDMAAGVTATKTGATYALASTQDHGSMEGRDLFREATKDEFEANPRFAPDLSPLARMAKLQNMHRKDGEPEIVEETLNKSLWEERDYSSGDQWGMVIDLNSCNGCQACVVACQSENNIPSVGKDQVAVGREMNWLRIDRYYSAGAGEAETETPAASDVGISHQPVPCMQCENAPCESVCPVAATTHSPDGLNDMVYNRCIGTRYCGNNCPFKVRRFNYFDFTKPLVEPTLQMAQNPDVTIRSRGVMEKCTYCLQRITGAKHQAKREGRGILDGEVVPACGQSCPSQAITFGNIVDPNSAVSKLRASDLNYAMLSERNLKPRTTYLAKVSNPNSELS